MGNNSAATGGGGSGVPDTIRPPKIRRKEKIKESLKNLKTPTQIIVSGLTKGEEVNRKFFEEKVKGLIQTLAFLFLLIL